MFPRFFCLLNSSEGPHIRSKTCLILWLLHGLLAVAVLLMLMLMLLFISGHLSLNQVVMTETGQEMRERHDLNWGT